MECIFCREAGVGATVEHVLPESLGGEEWAVVPADAVCAACNQYFGTKVEQVALAGCPFLPLRLLLGIPTKKGKAPKMGSHLGELRSGPGGAIEIKPVGDDIRKGIMTGEITQLRISAQPQDPVAVCRFLLKMGLEVVAMDSVKDALSSRFDEARAFARAPARGSRWWFLLAVDHDQLFKRFLKGVTAEEWAQNVHLSVSKVEGDEVFHLKFLDVSLITPLRPVFNPSPELSQNEPEWKLYTVTV